MSRSGPAHPTRAGRLLDVERFERVAAPGATALLRLIGRLPSPARVRPAALALVIHTGRATQRFAPLPSPDPLIDGDRLTAAFAVPVELLDASGVSFALNVGRRSSVALAAPSQRPLRGDRLLALEAEVESLRGRAAEAEELLAELDR